MRAVVGILGMLLMFGTLWETFESIILPRRVTRRFRLARLFYQVTWAIWSAVNPRLPSKKLRESHLSYYGPLSLLIAMLHWAAGSSLNVSGGPATFRTDLYLSGTTFFTLGLGDVTPRTAMARVITVGEGGMGFGFLAIVISYLPTMYGAFSQRELNISLLDARAGSPPTAGELLRRQVRYRGSDILSRYLKDWEIWCAQLMETHLSYPVLCYFRSQHDNQSWLAAYAAVLDVSALMIAYGAGEAKWQAQLTFAISRHAIADLCEVLRVRPRPCRGAQLARRIRRLQVHGSWRPETERTPKHVRAPIERPFPASAHADSIVGHRREIRGEIEADGLGPNHIRISRSKGSRWRGIWTFLAGSKVERCKAMGTSPRISLIRKWQIKGDNPGPAFPNLTVEADGDP